MSLCVKSWCDILWRDAPIASADDTFTPTYDLDGNQTLVKTKTGIWSVTYNGENRPVLWTCGTTNLTMKFDRMGRRVEYVETIGSITNKHQKFVYDGYLCIQRLNGSNNSITELFEWDPTEKVATRPMFMQYRVPGQTYALFYTHDGNKNVSEVVHYSRANGVAAHYEYAPFGEVTAQVRQGGIAAYDFAAINPWRFPSEYADDASATVYYNYRHYEPVMGRWTGRDPIDDLDIFANMGYLSEYQPQNLSEYMFAANTFRCDNLGLIIINPNCGKAISECTTEAAELSQKLSTYIGSQPSNKRNRSEVYARIKNKLKSLGFDLSLLPSSEDLNRMLQHIKDDLDAGTQEVNCCPPANLDVCDGKTEGAYIRKSAINPQWDKKIVLCKIGLDKMNDFGGCGCILLHELMHKWKFSTSQGISARARERSKNIENAMIYIARGSFKSTCNGNDVWN